MPHSTLMPQEDHGTEQISAAIRQRAGYGPPQHDGQQPELEPARSPDPDFGGGVRRAVPAEPDMSALIRQAHYGGYG